MHFNDFFTICRTPDLACEITLQPIRRYKDLLDAATIFSNIFAVLQAMGMNIEMLPANGPYVPDPLHTPEDIGKLPAVIDTDEELK